LSELPTTIWSKKASRQARPQEFALAGNAESDLSPPNENEIINDARGHDTRSSENDHGTEEDDGTTNEQTATNEIANKLVESLFWPGMLFVGTMQLPGFQGLLGCKEYQLV